MAKQWYVIHTQTGHEDRIKTAIDSKIQQGAAKDLIYQVINERK